ncbi:hypothetical protein ISN45_At01g038460 [Arabidopsis thaliana x Arabidopsis arenosa]|nr:hypothetical protein ISN45_At01g038460 [Arabidopsis thaliana x Arabidopsis arenosa]
MAKCWVCVCHFKTWSPISFMAILHLYLTISIWRCNSLHGALLVLYLKPPIVSKYPTIPISSFARIMPPQRAIAFPMCDPDLSRKPLFNIAIIGVNHHHKWLRGKKTGIMILYQRNSDYRSFSNLSSTFPLNLKFNQVVIISVKAFIHETRRMRKIGIIVPSLMSGCYRHFLSLLTPTAPDYSTIVTLLLADK